MADLISRDVLLDFILRFPFFPNNLKFPFFVQSIGLLACFRCFKILNCPWQLIIKRIKCHCVLVPTTQVNSAFRAL